MSKKNSAAKVTLCGFDDLFGANGDFENKAATVMEAKELPLQELHKFRDHPFRAQGKEKLEELAISVAEHGVILPGICRVRPQGGYEILAGHTRKRACEMAGLTTMPMVIRDLNDDEATIVMVDSNIQREALLPSERARAYKMRYEAMKHQGAKGNSLNQMSTDTGENAKKIQRYIWLARLTDDLLEWVDTKKLGLSQGVDISFLPSEQQGWVHDAMNDMGVSITVEQSAKIKTLSQKSALEEAVIRRVLSPKAITVKPRKIVFKSDKLDNYFGESYNEEQITDIIIGLLDEWKRKEETNGRQVGV
ncbi:MAG: ParB/RepB/Spo0J family partition protein [Firmicutes bacterium]|nr:ParB/RepB/Spo0J family partition protein [Bacillota bacterium]